MALRGWVAAVLVFGLALAGVTTAVGQEISKADNADALNLTSSWVGPLVPGPTNVAVWDSTITAYRNPWISGTKSWLGLKVTNPAATGTLRGSSGVPLTLGTAGVDMSAATQDFSLNVDVDLGANQTWDIAAGRQLELSSAQGAHRVAPVGGVRTLTKTGDGTLLVNQTFGNGSNPNNLRWAFNGGRVEVSHRDELHTSGTSSAGTVFSFDGGTLAFDNWGGGAIGGNKEVQLNAGGGTLETVGGISVEFNGQIKGSGSLSLNGSGTVVFSDNNSFTGDTIVNGGTLELRGGSYRVDDKSTLRINNGATVAFYSTNAIWRQGGDAPVIIDGGALVQAGGNHAHFLDVTMDNGATWTATSGTSFNGRNADLHGNLTVGGNAASTIGPFTTALQLAGDGAGIRTFNVADATGDAAEDLTVTAKLTGPGGLRKTGAGTAALRADNDFSGGTTVDAGRLFLEGGNSARPTGTGTLTINAGGTVEAANVYDGRNQFGNRNNDNVIPIVINGGTLIPSDYNHMNTLTMQGGTITAGASAGGDGLDFGESNGVAPSITTQAGGGAATIAALMTLRDDITIAVADDAVGADLTLSGGIVNPAAVTTITKTGAGSLVIDGTTGSGPSPNNVRWAFNGGEVVVSNRDELHTTGISNPGVVFDFDGGTLRFDDWSGGNVGGYKRARLNAGGGTFDLDASATVTFDGRILGSGDFTKAGAGTLILSENATYTGDTTVSGGTLRLSASNDAIVDGSTITVNSGATLEINATNAINRQGGGAPIILDGGTLNHRAGNHAHIQDLTLNDGATWTATSGGSFNGVNVDLHGVVTVGGNAASTIGPFTAGVGLSPTGAATATVFDVGDATGDAGVDLTVTAALKRGGGLTKTGVGTMLLNANNSYGGTTTVNGGTLALAGENTGNRLPANAQVIVGNGGTLDFRDTNTTPTGGGAIDVTINAGGVMTQTSGNHVHLRDVALNGGTWTTGPGAGTFNGENFRLGGDVTVGGSVPSTISPADGVALAGARTFNVADVTGDATPDLVVTTELENLQSGTGSLIKTGNGTMLLSGDNTYGGTTTVSAGTLLLDGMHGGSGLFTVAAGATLGGSGSAPGAPIELSGIVSPGNSPGILGPVPTFTFNAGSSYDWELLDANGGAGPGGWDQILATGLVTIDDANDFTIDVTGLSSVAPDVAGFPAGLTLIKGWQTGPFDAVQYGSLAFGAGDVNDILVNAGNLSSYGYFTVVDSGSSLDLYFTATVPEPGTWALFGLMALAGMFVLRHRRTV